MLKKLLMLFKIGRQLATSGAITSVYQIYNPSILVKIFFSLIGFNIGSKKTNNNMGAASNIVG